jgi:hypothetical protein
MLTVMAGCGINRLFSIIVPACHVHYSTAYRAIADLRYGKTGGGGGVRAAALNWLVWEWALEEICPIHQKPTLVRNFPFSGG